MFSEFGARSTWHNSPALSENQCHLSPLNSFPHQYPSSPSLHLISPFFSFLILLKTLASYRLFSWLGRPWLHWRCFHWEVGWKINEANNPENGISSLKCTTQTLKYIAWSKYTPYSQKYLFWIDEVYLYNLTSFTCLLHLFHLAYLPTITTCIHILRF